MAQTNYTPIQLYYSTTAAAVPVNTNLLNGELAININDGKLYYKDNSGTVQVIATKGAGTIGGSTTQIQYNNAGALAGSSAMVFNNSTNVVTLTTLNLTNALGAIYGGTGQSTYTTGDLLYSSASNTLSKLALGTANYILAVNSAGTNVEWAAPSAISVNTATNLAGGLAGSVPYQSGASTTTFLAIGAADRVMTSSGSAPQWVTALTGLTGVSSSSITNTSLTSGRVVYSSTGGLQANSANLTFDGTTLTTAGLSNSGTSALVKLVTVGGTSFSGTTVFAPATPAKLYMGTGTVTDATSAIGATNAVGAVASLAITPIAATNTSVTYTDAATLYIAGAPSAGTNITLTNPYALYIAAGNVYLGGGTANGVAYLNTSKVLTTGSALTFDGTALAPDGTGRTLGTTALRWGTVYATAFADGTDQLVGSSGAQARFGYGASWTSQSFAIGGSEQMRLTSTSLYTASTINVGIGTSSPLSKLDVRAASAAMGNYQTIQAFSTDTSAAIDLGGGISLGGFYNSTQIAMFGSIAGRKENGTSGNYAGYLSFGTNSQATGVREVMRLDSSGNLGLGIAPDASDWNASMRVFHAYQNTTNGAGVKLQSSNAKMIMSAGNAINYIGSIGLTPLYFVINSSPAMTLDASGNLGIGTSSPGAKLEVNQAATAFPGFKITGSNSPGMQIVEATGVTAHFVNDSAGVYVGSSTSYPLIFRTNNTERARFNTTGAFVLAGGTTTANGIGITFPATQSASSDANTLDDYEEGTWTPVLQFGANTQTITAEALYTKVGRAVNINLTIAWTAKSGSGRVYITGLPFAKGGSGTIGLIATCAAGSITTTSALFYNIDGGQTILNLAQQSADIDSANIAASGTIACTGTYFV